MLITEGGCKQVKNVAPDPTTTFAVGKRDMSTAIARGLLAIVHSHPDYPDCPSEADMRRQIASGVPWGIVATDGQQTTPIRWWGDGDREPLVGRGFVHGITDCYALIRDYYAAARGIELPEYLRNWEWWRIGQDLYRDGFRDAGFRVIGHSEAQAGDMWLAQLRSDVPNHGGILLDSGLCLHHPSASSPVNPARISRREPIGRWLPHITHWLRHEQRQKRDLSDRRYVYWWADGVYSNVRMDDRLCLLVIIGVTEQGRKELIVVEDGFRESATSWETLLTGL